MKTRIFFLTSFIILLCSAARPLRSGHTYDVVLLKRFVEATRSLDFNRAECTYSGVVNLIDPNDTTNTTRNLSFLFCRDATGYYYRVGSTEMIHEADISVFIRHDQRRVVLSHEQMAVKAPFGDMNKIAERFRDEDYMLKKTNHGRVQTISFINEQHVSCKEMSVTLDTVTGKLQRLYARLTDFGSPKDKGLDRVMDVRINELSMHANRKTYPGVNSVLVTRGSRRALSAKYANYELITL